MFLFSVGKKNLCLAECCHMAEGCQTNPEYFAGSTSNMADAWREDLKLREDMERYVRQGYKREEALDFLKRDFPMYPWSICSLDEEEKLPFFLFFFAPIPPRASRPSGSRSHMTLYTASRVTWRLYSCLTFLCIARYPRPNECSRDTSENPALRNLGLLPFYIPVLHIFPYLLSASNPPAKHPPCWTWIPQSILGLFGSPQPCGSVRPRTNFFFRPKKKYISGSVRLLS